MGHLEPNRTRTGTRTTTLRPPEPARDDLSAVLYRRDPPGAAFGCGGGTPLSAKKQDVGLGPLSGFACVLSWLMMAMLTMIQKKSRITWSFVRA